jgi:Zn-dependent M28 family amino/carboxypeptidase
MKLGLSSYLTSIATALLGGCGGGEISAPPFDGSRAYQYLHEQVNLGPRVPGSASSAAARNYYVRHFQSAGLTVDSQKVFFKDPYSDNTLPLVNISARFEGTGGASDRILLAAHYDCRPRTDNAFDSSKRNDPIAGANDGASGVAILMELANLFKLKAPEVSVDLVLFDGEDWGKASELDYYSLGSKAFAQTPIREKYRFGIVLDMVGDLDQQIYREVYSEQFQKPLNDMIWEVAATLKVPTFIDTTRHTVIDDHLPLNIGGVPTVDIIDFDYPYWHTEMDTPDKCSAAALANVGKIVAHIAYNKQLWPKN